MWTWIEDEKKLNHLSSDSIYDLDNMNIKSIIIIMHE